MKMVNMWTWWNRYYFLNSLSFINFHNSITLHTCLWIFKNIQIWFIASTPIHKFTFMLIIINARKKCESNQTTSLQKDINTYFLYLRNPLLWWNKWLAIFQKLARRKKRNIPLSMILVSPYNNNIKFINVTNIG